MVTATDVTIEHYQCDEVRATILRYCMGPGSSFRALNGDSHWYMSTGPGMVRLTNPDDYNDIIKENRTLYTTIDILDDAVKNVFEKWDGTKGSPENTIGTLRDCWASLSALI